MVPAVAYWNPTVPAWEGSDTRLEPYKDTVSEYFFIAPTQGGVTIQAKLIYRYAFIDLIRQKGWPLQDILVDWKAATID
jgi:hypothetical protein